LIKKNNNNNIKKIPPLSQEVEPKPMVIAHTRFSALCAGCIAYIRLLALNVVLLPSIENRSV